jgi:phenylacetate-CoA ligase
MSNILAKLIYLAGIFMVNPLIYRHRLQLRATEFYSDEKLDRLQIQKLKLLLRHAKSYSPYYRDILTGINIENITLKDMSMIPLLTKETLRDQDERIYTRKFSFSMLIKSETSGSSGDAFVFYRNKSWDAAHRAAIWRGINQHSVQPWDHNLYLWGFVFDRKSKFKIRILDFLQNRFRIFQINTDELIKNLPKIRKVKFISGYSSVINSLVGLLDKSQLRIPNLKMIKGTSEKIYPSYQKRAKRILGLPIVSEYGAAETGIISFTCPSGINHTVRENVIVESVDGRAVVTNLESFSMPIIRLDLGDYIDLDRVSCDCGRHSQVVNDVMGRVGAAIYGRVNQYPSLSLYYIFKDLALIHNTTLSYQGVQNTKGKLVLLIFDEPSSFDAKVIQDVANKYLPDVDVEVCLGDYEARHAKLKDFVSNVISDS